MGYIEENLIREESIIYRARIHWIIYSPGVLVLALSFLFTLSTPLSNVDENNQIRVGAALTFFVGLPMIVRAWMRRIATELAVTSRRVIAKFGLVSRKTVELNHEQVESLSVSQSILGRFFNFGTLIVNGTGGIRAPIPVVDNPLDFRKKVLETVEASRQ